MASLKRVMQRLSSTTSLSLINTDLVSLISAVSPQAPLLNLPHVDTQLNMHQINGLFEDGTPAADGLRGRSKSLTTVCALLTHRAVPSTDSHGSPSQPSNPSNPPNPSANPNPNPTSTTDETPTEWSAVGHAATGKSGRVIHNLQEEIARLRRECGVYRSRAEETQRSNETLKTQVVNMSERLQNLEQVNETNLNSIARKDRKVDELRNELQSERDKRKEAESSASKTNDMMRDEREIHHREQAEAQELTKYHQTQFEVLASSTKREKAELGRRVKNLYDELKNLKNVHEEHCGSTQHLDVIAEQKNREIEGLKELHEKLVTTHVEYKKIKDDELRDEMARSRANNDKIEATLASVKETEGKMKWAINLYEIWDERDRRAEEKRKEAERKEKEEKKKEEEEEED